MKQELKTYICADNVSGKKAVEIVKDLVAAHKRGLASRYESAPGDIDEAGNLTLAFLRLALRFPGIWRLYSTEYGGVCVQHRDWQDA